MTKQDGRKVAGLIGLIKKNFHLTIIGLKIAEKKGTLTINREICGPTKVG